MFKSPSPDSQLGARENVSCIPSFIHSLSIHVWILCRLCLPRDHCINTDIGSASVPLEFLGPVILGAKQSGGRLPVRAGHVLTTVPSLLSEVVCLKSLRCLS